MLIPIKVWAKAADMTYNGAYNRVRRGYMDAVMKRNGKMFIDVTKFEPCKRFHKRELNLQKANELIEIISGLFGLPIDTVKGKARQRKYLYPRYMAMSILNDKKGMFKLSTTQIGGLFSDRDHSTVIHAVREHHNMMATDEFYRANFIGVLNNIINGAEFVPNKPKPSPTKITQRQKAKEERERFLKMIDIGIGETFECDEPTKWRVFGHMSNNGMKDIFKTTRIGGGMTKFIRIK